MPDQLTDDQIYDSQEEWIKENCSLEASKIANYGWAVDEVYEVISTKVYGFGVLTTSMTTGEHTYEPF